MHWPFTCLHSQMLFVKMGLAGGCNKDLQRPNTAACGSAVLGG